MTVARMLLGSLPLAVPGPKDGKGVGPSLKE